MSLIDPQVGFDIATGSITTDAQTTGAQAIIDATASNTPIFVRTSAPSPGRLAGSLVLNNVKLTNVPVAVGVVGGAVVLNGGTTTIASWGQGNVYKGTSGSGTFTQGNIPAPSKSSSLLDSSGRIVGRTHPQYANYHVSQFVSVRDLGAKGDGVTDDTAALKDIFAKVYILPLSKNVSSADEAYVFSILVAKSSSLMLDNTLSPIQSQSPLALRWSEKHGLFCSVKDPTSRTRTALGPFSELAKLDRKVLLKSRTLSSPLLVQLRGPLSLNGTSSNPVVSKLVLACGIHISGEHL